MKRNFTLGALLAAALVTASIAAVAAAAFELAD